MIQRTLATAPHRLLTPTTDQPPRTLPLHVTTRKVRSAEPSRKGLFGMNYFGIFFTFTGSAFGAFGVVERKTKMAVLGVGGAVTGAGLLLFNDYPVFAGIALFLGIGMAFGASLGNRK